MSLYEQIFGVAREYMGVAAEDYIQRRIRIVQHGKDPTQIAPDRMERLIAGVRMTANGYMSQRRADAFCDELSALVDS